MLTKKHFIAEAARIKKLLLAGGNYQALQDIANSCADDFAKENPRFDRARFIAACGVGA